MSFILINNVVPEKKTLNLNNSPVQTIEPFARKENPDQIKTATTNNRQYTFRKFHYTSNDLFNIFWSGCSL